MRQAKDQVSLTFLKLRILPKQCVMILGRLPADTCRRRGWQHSRNERAAKHVR